jgi:hypothetical protein
MIENPSRPPHYTYSILQFIFALLALAGLLTGSAVLLFLGLTSSILPTTEVNAALGFQTLSMFLMAGGLAFFAVLVIPSVYYAYKSFNGKAVVKRPQLPAYLRPSVLIFALPLVILLGYFVSQRGGIAWLLMPLLHILAIGLPILWIVYLAARHLPLGSPQRMWGIFDSGLVLGPSIVMFFEMLALVGVVIIAIFFLLNQPDLVKQINNLMESLQQGVVNEEQFVQQFTPLLAQPGVILAALLFVSVIVPLIEESLKPIGIWLLAGFDLTPAAGFVGGALCGAGFAFFESLALAGSGTDWAVSATARVGTGVIHITNSALMGWALTTAWQKKRYWILGLTYLGVVLIHGTWNGLAVLNLVSQLAPQPEQTILPGAIAWIGTAAPYILLVMGIALFGLLLWMNAWLRRTEPVQTTPEAPPVEPIDDDQSQTVL